jgi:alpha-amylase
MKTRTLYLLFAAIVWNVSCSTTDNNNNIKDEKGWDDEIVYHVMQRSFYDSNGDRNGDLNGFISKLDYLKELGVTAILFLPLYESDFYHNYFPKDYEKIDPEFGTMDDYLRFIKAVHANGLKFIMDMETQYAQEGHPWYMEDSGNQAGPHSGFIYGPMDPFRTGKKTPFRLKGYNNYEGAIDMLDLNNPALRNYMKKFYAKWTDPDGDGKFDDGVDGFRIDHIMNDLDNLGIFTNLYTGFWKPVFDTCRMINPDLFIAGEQANWGDYGEEMIGKTGVDASFGFLLRFAISGAPVDYMGGNGGKVNRNELNALNIMKSVEETVRRIPRDKHFLNFIENHDVERFASAMQGNVAKIRCGGVLNLLLPGIPSIYYGQELGLTGQVGNWGSDGNHIPVREAFPWTPDASDKGIAVFYKDTGPWGNNSIYMTGASGKLALSAEKRDPNSLWNFYRDLILLRRKNKVFIHGEYKPIPVDDSVMCFSRQFNEDRAIVIMNLSNGKRKVDLEKLDAGSFHSMFGKNIPVGNQSVDLDAFEFTVLKN